MAKNMKKGQEDKKAENTEDRFEGRRKVELTDQQVTQIYEASRNTLESLNARRRELFNARNEIEITLLAIEEISSSKKGEKLMVPVGAGIYLDAELSDSDGFRMNLPGGIFKKVNSAAAKAELGKRREDLMKNIAEIDKEMEKALQDVNKWGKIVRDVSQAKRQARSNSA